MIDEDEKIGLLPCPFCGGKARFDRGICNGFVDGVDGRVYCSTCFAEVTINSADTTNWKERIAFKWNRRPSSIKKNILLTRSENIEQNIIEIPLDEIKAFSEKMFWYPYTKIVLKNNDFYYVRESVDEIEKLMRKAMK